MLQQLITFVQARVNDEQGATAVEYALLVAFIGMVIIVGATALGLFLNDEFLSFNW